MAGWLLSLVVLGLLGLLGCAAGANKDRSPGEVTFRASCQTCHRLPNPASKTDGEWPPLVARYGERAGLTEEKIDLIREYLISAN
jgi:hypothetical protein